MQHTPGSMPKHTMILNCLHLLLLLSFLVLIVVLNNEGLQTVDSGHVSRKLL